MLQPAVVMVLEAIYEQSFLNGDAELAGWPAVVTKQNPELRRSEKLHHRLATH